MMVVEIGWVLLVEVEDGWTVVKIIEGCSAEGEEVWVLM